MKIRALFALVATVAISVTAQDAPPQHIDIHGLSGEKKGAEIIGQVVVPVPSEIFGILDKQVNKPAWAEVLRSTKGVVAIGNPEQLSLILGTVIAEGFVAVEAEDAEEVKNIGRTVLSLSKAIGVQKSVTRRSKAIIDASDKRAWKDVRKELEGALTDVKKAMDEMQNADHAQLVSLAGWLRGLEALTLVVEKNYSKDGAELLHQPVLLNYFKRQIDGMETKKKDPLVQKVRKGLIDIEPLIGTGDADIPEKSVKEIQTIATDLIKAINQKQNP